MATPAELAVALYSQHAVMNVVSGESSPNVLVTLEELRTLAREAAGVGWEEGRDTEYYFHYDNPYKT